MIALTMKARPESIPSLFYRHFKCLSDLVEHDTFMTNFSASK